MRTVSRCLGAASLLSVLLVSDATAQTTAPLPNLKEWFQQVDKNGDGKLTREEFYRGIIEIFYFRDKNKDGFVTIEELEGASPEAIKAASRSGSNRLTLDEYVNALFKDFAAADKDGDGNLTIEEIDIYIRTNKR